MERAIRVVVFVVPHGAREAASLSRLDPPDMVINFWSAGSERPRSKRMLYSAFFVWDAGRRRMSGTSSN